MTGKHDSGRIEKILHFGYILKVERVFDNRMFNVKERVESSISPEF